MRPESGFRIAPDHVNFITGSGVIRMFFIRINQKSKNRKYPRLSFVQYLETEAGYEYQIWLDCI